MNTHAILVGKRLILMASGLRPNALTLGKALELNNRPVAEDAPRQSVFLACGCAPLHLIPFLKAHARLRFPNARIDIATGLFDDLAGSIESLAESTGRAVAVLIEWSDLDPRLGFRHSGGWTPSLFADIESEVTRRLDRLALALRAISGHSVAAVKGPTLPLPPIGITVAEQESAFELRLRASVAAFLAGLAPLPGLRVVSDTELCAASDPEQRLDLKMALAAGFPYTVAHTDAVARLLVANLFPAESKKGLITDLDDTLWQGLVGEAGADQVQWSLEEHAQLHGLYQQLLASLAERGVLIAVASKNDPAPATAALARADLLVPSSALFPVEVNWGPKSTSVARILKAWNIGAQDVVFVDDSPMELAEVSAAFPQITALPFPRKDPQQLWQLLRQMRSLFGRQAIQEEDRLRVASLRNFGEIRDHATGANTGEFIRQLAGEVTVDFSKDPQNTRAFELVNKTNQFNLNGRRWTEDAWRAMLTAPGTLLATVSYTDKFGPLGKIAVVAGRMQDGVLSIDTMVMSCRAFSRRIEYRVLEQLIERYAPSLVRFDYQATDRNGPVREFLEAVLGHEPGASPIEIAAEAFAAKD